MPKKSKPSTTLSAIENSLVAEGGAFFRNFQKQNPRETIYGFLFELSGLGYAAAAAIATEESLARFAQECEDDYDGDLERAKDELRWAGPENGWYQSDDKHFRSTNKLLELAEECGLYPEYDGTLEKIALSAIQRMMSDGVFGLPSEREKVVLGICHTGGDNSEEDFLRWASAVNSPAVIQRLEAELKKGG